MSSSFQRVEHLRQRLADYLRADIFALRRKPGERIVESVVARELGVGQPTIREALQVLEHEGLVVRTSNKGCRVTNLTEEDVAKIYQVRIELESLAASLIPRTQAASVAEDLESCLLRMEDAGRRNSYEDFRDADMEFHRTIWRVGGNEYIVKALEAITIPLFAFAGILFYGLGRTIAPHHSDDHRVLVNVIRHGPTAEATRVAFREVMRQLQTEAVNSIRERHRLQGAEQTEADAIQQSIIENHSGV
jgi:DNA-binding GntR family transcriptional regulator